MPLVKRVKTVSYTHLTERMPKDFWCILHGRDTGKSGGCYLVGKSWPVSGLYQCGQNRDTRGIYQKNAFFRYSPVSNTGTKPQLQNGVPGRLRHRKKTYRYSPDGIKAVSYTHLIKPAERSYTSQPSPQKRLRPLWSQTIRTVQHDDGSVTS